MSSVLIKGMEMPKDCRECPLCNYHIETGETWCEAIDGLLATDYGTILFDGRDSDCPLAEIKTPHGRLIEEPKKLEYGGLVYIAPLDFVGIAKYFYNQIHAQPTVIEAED